MTEAVRTAIDEPSAARRADRDLMQRPKARHAAEKVLYERLGALASPVGVRRV